MQRERHHRSLARPGGAKGRVCRLLSVANGQWQILSVTSIIDDHGAFLEGIAWRTCWRRGAASGLGNCSGNWWGAGAARLRCCRRSLTKATAVAAICTCRTLARTNARFVALAVIGIVAAVVAYAIPDIQSGAVIVVSAGRTSAAIGRFIANGIVGQDTAVVTSTLPGTCPTAVGRVCATCA